MASDVDTRSAFGLDERVMVPLGALAALSIVVFELIPQLQGYAVVHGGIGVLASLLAPGYLLLLNAGVDPRRTSHFLAYAVGASTAFLTVVGVGTYFLFAGLGAERPLVGMPWVLALSLVVLSGFAYRRRDEGLLSHRPSVSASPRSLLSVTLLVLLPLLSIAASSAINSRGDNLPMLLQIALLGGAVALLAGGVIPARLRPFAIWSVALSVLLGMTLVSSHLWGWDVHFEYYTAQRIFYDGVWTPAAEGPTNSLLSVTFLAAVFASVTGLEPVSVYKLIYPLVGALLPVGIYYLGRLRFDDEWVATLAPFALIFYYGFFKIMPDKQLISQVFLVLVLVAVFDDSLRGVRKWLLAMTFGTMLIFSHYGVSLAFVGFLVATKLIVTALRRFDVADVEATGLTSTFTALLGLEWIGWYLFSASGENLARILDILDRLVRLQFPASGRSGVGYATKAFESPYWAVYRLLMVVLVGLLCLGVARALYRLMDGESDGVSAEYVVLSAVFLLFLVTSTIETYGMGFDRTLLLTLTLVAPFAVVGARTALSVPAALSERVRARYPLSSRTTASAFAAFLVLFFLFSSGAAFAVAGEDVPSYSINLDRDAGWPVYQNNEVAATRWIEERSPADSKVAVYNQWDSLKSRDALLVREVVSRDRIAFVWPEMRTLAEGQYVYLTDEPMVEEAGAREYIDPTQTRFYERNVVTADRVYSSGDARVFLSNPSGEGGDQPSDPGANATDERQDQRCVQRGAAGDDECGLGGGR